ncbi:class I tRNA ligase family protein [Saccharothrix sp. HUAS TT1]|uniref:class I tRNA ligase family protein n=1 Tax=unclassified Saccharothrix TaxID=2593673 RepID=UPI00345BE391
MPPSSQVRPISRCYVTTSIPHVDARPHLEHALELVQADALARHHRLRGDRVRFLAGVGDDSPKDAPAAEAEELVDRGAAAFAALREPLALSFTDFTRAGRDAGRRAGVDQLWRACVDAGDLYREHHESWYCVGCEQSYPPAELDDGKCPRHGVEPQRVAEESWFFRLSRHSDALRELIGSGEVRVEPPRGATRCWRSSTPGCATSASPGRAPSAGAPPCRVIPTR